LLPFAEYLDRDVNDGGRATLNLDGTITLRVGKDHPMGSPLGEFAIRRLS